MISDPAFWIALPITVAIFWLLPFRWRMHWLALASWAVLAVLDLRAALLFLAWGGWYYRLTVGKGGSRKLHLVVGSMVGLLGIFKLAPVLLREFVGPDSASVLWVPLGVSYLSFRLIHFAIEAHRGRFEDLLPSEFFAYLFLFPIFSAGPIERLDHWLEHRERHWRAAQVQEGLQRIVHGLIKKFVIGDLIIRMVLGPYQDGATLFLERLSLLPVYKVWGFLGVSFLYYYFDFAGYSDIAIGTSRLFGLRIQENFNWPILARNINEFWKRWHITLAAWCQAYIYMPILGRSRNPYLAVTVTFLAMGLWHAPTAHWLLWGLFHATGAIVASAWLRYRRRRRWSFLDRAPWRGAGVLLTMLAVSASFSFIVPYPDHSAFEGLRIFLALWGVRVGL